MELLALLPFPRKEGVVALFTRDRPLPPPPLAPGLVVRLRALPFLAGDAF